MKEKNYTVYKHICPNNKVYIGITSQKPKDRWNSGYGYIQNKHFFNAIMKYGWRNIQHEILFANLTKKEACELEIKLIEQYKSNDRNYGYNNSTGGEIPSKGVKCSEERKRHLKQTCKFKKGMYIGEKSPRARKINQYSLKGEFIKTWGSAMDIQRALNINYTNVIKCCGFHQLYAKNYFWLYEEEANRIEEKVKIYNTPVKLSEERKRKISASLKGKPKNKKRNALVS